MSDLDRLGRRVPTPGEIDDLYTFYGDSKARLPATDRTQALALAIMQAIVDATTATPPRNTAFHRTHAALGNIPRDVTDQYLLGPAMALVEAALSDRWRVRWCVISNLPGQNTVTIQLYPC